MTDTLASQDLADRLADAERLIAHLQHALVNARAISAAVGIVMTTNKLTYDTAFDWLAARSQVTNVKLRVLAHEIVFTGALP